MEVSSVSPKILRTCIVFCLATTSGFATAFFVISVNPRSKPLSDVSLIAPNRVSPRSSQAISIESCASRDVLIRSTPVLSCILSARFRASPLVVVPLAMRFIANSPRLLASSPIHGLKILFISCCNFISSLISARIRA